MGDDGSRRNLDAEYANQIKQLLSTPSPQSMKDYYDGLISSEHGVKVLFNNEHGKGVCASRTFAEGDLILKDQILVGDQHSSNKIDCFVCSHCFCFLGSIELQIGRRLYLRNLGISVNNDCQGQKSHFANEMGSSGKGKENCFGCVEDRIGSSSGTKSANLLQEETLESLMNGHILLPFTSKFSLPSVVPCPRACGEVHYCSQQCADADWESFHSLLCTVQISDSSRRSALQEFVEHACETNDIFLVAAKAIAFTVLRYRKLKRLQLSNKDCNRHPAKEENSDFSLLLEAWKPLSMGFKKRWWECIALPDDVEPCDEMSFRMEIRDLANSSLQLLKNAIFDIECAPLFSLEIYGHIIGMFELNNLDLAVASPVEDYVLFINDLPDGEKEEAEKVTKPFLDALGEDYSIPCEGTAFYPLQSCMNHSCCPNAKAFKRDEDKDGHAIIVALKPISVGEEVTISYIDEDLPYEERQALLADYGFECRCPRCLDEQPKHQE